MQPRTLFSSTAKTKGKPTIELEKLITSFLSKLPSVESLADFSKVHKARIALVKELQDAEKKRPPLREPAYQQRAQIEAQSQLNAVRSNYAAERKQHDEEIRRITSDAEEVDRVLQDAYTKTEVSSIRGMIARVDRHYRTTEILDELNAEKPGCCGCFGFFRRKQLRNDLEKRKADTDAAQKDDQKNQQQEQGDIDRLAEQEATLWARRRALQIGEPILDDDREQQRFASINAVLSENASIHYHTLPIDAMLECVRFYQQLTLAKEAILELIKKSPHQASLTATSAPIPIKKLSAISPKGSFTDLGHKLQQAIQQRAEQFSTLTNQFLLKTTPTDETIPLLSSSQPPSELAQLTQLSGEFIKFIKKLENKLQKFYCREAGDGHKQFTVMDCIDNFNALPVDQQQICLDVAAAKDIPEEIRQAILPPAQPQVCVAFAARQR